MRERAWDVAASWQSAANQIMADHECGGLPTRRYVEETSTKIRILTHEICETRENDPVCSCVSRISWLKTPFSKNTNYSQVFSLQAFAPIPAKITKIF
jgi:hypothetical protein